MLPNTRRILLTAKRSALAAQRSEIGLFDLACALFLHRDDPAVRGSVVKALGREVDRWSDSVRTHADRVDLDTPVSEDPVPFDDHLGAVIGRAHREALDFDVEPLVRTAATLYGSVLAELGLVAADVGASVSPPPPVAAAETTTGTAGSGLRGWVEVSDQAQRIEELLRARVLGQNVAANMLARAWFRATVTRSGHGTGPRGIFTFLGPPGVGKSLMAEAFAEALGSVSNGPTHAFARLDMASYAGHQSHEELFGAAPFYSGNRPGRLTGFAKANPNAVVLLDEIEKAHPNTLNALLAVLDRGTVEDRQAQATVSFENVWFVCTTNLGQDLFRSRNRTGILESRNDASVLALELLASAVGEGRGAYESRPVLPPEFVSRLSKGGVAIFSDLGGREFLALAERATREMRFGVANGPPARVEFSPDASELFLLSLAPRIDARTVDARARSAAANALARALDDLRDEIGGGTADELRVWVTCDEESRAFLRGRLRGEPLYLLLVDEDRHVAATLERELGEHHVRILHAPSADGIADACVDRRPDLALVDLSIGVAPDSPDVRRGTDALDAIRGRFPELPILVFSEEPERRRDFDDAVKTAIRHGGARGYLPLRGKGRGADAWSAQMRVLADECRFVAVDRALREQLRSHRTVETSWESVWISEAATAEVRFVGPRERQILSYTDQPAALGFQGIPSERFSDVIGLTRAKRRLQQTVQWLRNPGQLAALGAAPPRGFLLAGRPGTGKTLLARAVAGESGLPFVSLSPGQLRSKWVGESEKNVREVFERAQQYAPAIVFIDEIDSLGRRDADDGDTTHHDRGVINQLLACMDGFTQPDRPVFVLGATNHPDRLDPALRRPGRFDEVVPIDVPNPEARRRFFEQRCAGLPLAPDVVFDSLVSGTTGATPAELDRIVREAVYLAAGDNRAIVTAADLETARRIVRYGNPSESLNVRPEDLRLTAYHEAGHAIVHLTLCPDIPIEHLTIVPDERGALGFLATTPDESAHATTRAQVRARLAVLLAGREAERKLAGDDGITTGATSDLRQATALARAAVCEYGFDEEIGPVAMSALRNADDPPHITTSVRRWLADAERDAVAVLDSESAALEKLAAALLENEALDATAVRRIVGPVRGHE